MDIENNNNDDNNEDEVKIPVGDLKDFIRKSIDRETDEDSKIMSTMLLMFMEYADYVNNLDPSLHDRAMSYATETHGLDTVSISIEKVEPSDSDESGN